MKELKESISDEEKDLDFYGDYENEDFIFQM